MTVINTDIPDTAHPSCVIVWNDDGRYTPRCTLCPYVGTSRARRCDAASALREHRTSRYHRMKIKGRVA